MSVKRIKEYNLQKKARNVAETPWLALPGKNKLTRRLVKLEFIRDYEDPDKFRGIHLSIQYQSRSSEKEEWPSKPADLRKFPKNASFKFNLDSGQTKEVYDALGDAYRIGSNDISTGKRTVLKGIGKDEFVITDKNKVSLLRQLSQTLTEKEVDDWLRGNLSFISSNTALLKIYKDRESIIEEFENALDKDKDEDYWRQFLKKNKWVFGSAYVSIIDEERIDIHHTTDLPFEVEEGFMDIVEIKRPSFPFWKQSRAGENYLYRGKFLIPHKEIQGAISQLSKYIYQTEQQVNSRQYVKDHGGIIPLKPKGLIAHGRSKNWEELEKVSFRLLNDGLHNIQIITFDQLLDRARRALQFMEADDIEEEIIAQELEVENFPF